MPSYPMLEEYATERGLVRLSRPARGVVQTIVTGYASPDIAERIIEWVDRAIADGERPAVFHDWDGATGYDPRVRPRFATWYARIRNKVSSVHVFTRSKVVSMGVALVSIAMNNAIVAYQERRPFEVALAAAIKAAH